jgi:hypothetical protein
MSANVGFAGLSYRWFIGQVPPDQNEHSKNADWIKEAWSSRVKVRIPGIHDVGEVTDENLPWAIIAKPTSQGNYSGGSTGIYAGEWVIGFFLDEGNQVPVITHVLSRNTDERGLNESKDGSTYFKTVSKYTSGVEAAFHQTKSGAKPTSSVGSEIPIGDWEAAKGIKLNINNS